MSKFSENMKRARRGRGWTQSEAAKVLNTTRSNVGSWEEGRGHPNLQMLVNIARVYNVKDLLEFIGGYDSNYLKTTKATREMKIIEHYYLLDPTHKKIVDIVLQLEQ